MWAVFPELQHLTFWNKMSWIEFVNHSLPSPFDFKSLKASDHCFKTIPFFFFLPHISVWKKNKKKNQSHQLRLEHIFLLHHAKSQSSWVSLYPPNSFPHIHSYCLTPILLILECFLLCPEEKRPGKKKRHRYKLSAVNFKTVLNVKQGHKKSIFLSNYPISMTGLMLPCKWLTSLWSDWLIYQ